MIANQTYPPYYQNYPYYPQYQQPVIQQPPAQIPTQPQPQPQMQVQNQILSWVQSEDEAMKFPLSAGQSMFLMNTNSDYLYMKSVDQLGKSTFIKKKLVDETEGKDSKIDLSEYIKREEIENLISDRIQAEVEKRMSEMSFKATKAKKRSSDYKEE